MFMLGWIKHVTRYVLGVVNVNWPDCPIGIRKSKAGAATANPSFPSVAVCATGSTLMKVTVEPDQQPLPAAPLVARSGFDRLWRSQVRFLSGAPSFCRAVRVPGRWR